MYKLSIPVANKDRTPEEIESFVEELKRAGTDEVMLVYNRVLCSKEWKDENHKTFLKNKKKDVFLRKYLYINPRIPVVCISPKSTAF